VAYAVLSLSMTLEWTLLRDRTRGLPRRLLATPIEPWRLVLHQRAFVASALYAMALVCALLGGVVWKIPPVRLGEVHAYGVAVVLFLTGFMGVLFGLAGGQRSAGAMSGIAMVTLLFFGGTVLPVEFYPESLRRVTQLTPMGRANLAVVALLTGRPSPVSLAGTVAYAAAFFALGTWVQTLRLRKE
jgi:ABC-2 type transport system permease protein